MEIFRGFLEDVGEDLHGVEVDLFENGGVGELDEEGVFVSHDHVACELVFLREGDVGAGGEGSLDDAGAVTGEDVSCCH